MASRIISEIGQAARWHTFLLFGFRAPIISPLCPKSACFSQGTLNSRVGSPFLGGWALTNESLHGPRAKVWAIAEAGATALYEILPISRQRQWLQGHSMRYLKSRKEGGHRILYGGCILGLPGPQNLTHDCFLFVFNGVGPLFHILFVSRYKSPCVDPCPFGLPEILTGAHMYPCTSVGGLYSGPIAQPLDVPGPPKCPKFLAKGTNLCNARSHSDSLRLRR